MGTTGSDKLSPASLSVRYVPKRTQNLEDHAFVRGTVAVPFMLAHRIDRLKCKLPELFKRVDRLEKVFSYLSADVTKG